jgi:hypothetical protein
MGTSALDLFTFPTNKGMIMYRHYVVGVLEGKRREDGFCLRNGLTVRNPQIIENKARSYNTEAERSREDNSRLERLAKEKDINNTTNDNPAINDSQCA